MIDQVESSETMVDDNIDDLFQTPSAAALASPIFRTRVPQSSQRSRSVTKVGMGFTNPSFILEAAAQIEANIKAESKLLSAENRKIKREARIAAGEIPAPRKSAVKKVSVKKVAKVAKRVQIRVSGGAIPEYITGTPIVTGTFEAKTGKAIIIDIDAGNQIATDIVVWSGPLQTSIAEAAISAQPLRVRVRQPANDNYKPSISWVGKA